MLRTEANSALANPSAVHFDDIKSRPSATAEKSGEHPTVRRVPPAESRLRLNADVSGESAQNRFAVSQAAGEVDVRAIIGKTEAELSWALAASTPLAVLGATLLAHGTTLPSDLCMGLGVACIVAIGVLQFRVRMRVRGFFSEEAVAQGLPSSLGKQHAQRYLNAWFR